MTPCLDSEAKLWGLFDPSLAPETLYYAYVPIILVSVLLGFFVYRQKAEFHLPHKLFFIFTILYGFYLLNEINQWVAVPAGMVHFSWSIIALFYISIPIVLFYFVYTYLTGKDLSFKAKSFLVATTLPIILLLPTQMNIYDFDLLNCEGDIGPLHYYYLYALMFAYGLLTIFVSFKSFLKTKRKDAIVLLIGASAMIFILLFADLVSEYLGNFEFNLIGPIGMMVFIFSISYMIVSYGAFNISVLAATALVLGLLILIGSQIFFVESRMNLALVIFTLILATIGGYALVQSVRREHRQRESLEKLTLQLEKANIRLKELDKLKSEFVSIASHQLRSPLTAIRGYASLLLEGSYGNIPKKAQEALTRIDESSKNMAYSIEDYLNVSRIESGNMKYNLADFNLRDEAEHVADDLRPQAIKKGLGLIFRTDLKSKGIINADVGKVIQIVQNLVNNSIKYTEQGSIRIFVHDDVVNKKIYVDIEDTGIGMSEATQARIFKKFERADNANTVNKTGTGLGLYVAYEMAKGMGGDISAHSEGDGKGSRFTIEFPLAL